MDLFILIIVLLIFGETSFLAFSKYRPLKNSGRKIYVDTSTLIDGRILNIARTGFLGGDLIVLKSVLLELQLIADSKDPDKRARARTGLETVAELERVVNINTEIYEDTTEKKKVDEILLKIAKENKGAILTLDYNLIKVAEAENIDTLNINDLALAIRNEFLPGEKIKLKITEKGANQGQGVGHLPDGTMVIVDHGASKIGQAVTVEFVRFYETSAGKMIFARIVKSKRLKR